VEYKIKLKSIEGLLYAISWEQEFITQVLKKSFNGFQNIKPKANNSFHVST
jgi:hypothetical protein